MKSVSVVNQPGGVSRYESETRIVGFRVECDEIVNLKGEKHYIVSTDIIEDLAIQYLKDKGYSVEKS